MICGVYEFVDEAEKFGKVVSDHDKSDSNSDGDDNDYYHYNG